MELFTQCFRDGHFRAYKIAQQQLFDRAQRLSAPVNIVTGVLYIAARLALFAIMFSSLRAVPKGVYETSDWTRFLPNFS